MKIINLVFILVSISLINLLQARATEGTKCKNGKPSVLAVCNEIISSEIDGRPEDKIISAELIISKLKDSPVICIYGKMKDVLGGIAGFDGVIHENGTSPWVGSLVTIEETPEVLKSHIKGAPKSKEQRGPSEYDQIELNKKDMTLTFRKNTGVSAFATLRMKCIKPVP